MKINDICIAYSKLPVTIIGFGSIFDDGEICPAYIVKVLDNCNSFINNEYGSFFIPFMVVPYALVEPVTGKLSPCNITDLLSLAKQAVDQIFRSYNPKNVPGFIMPLSSLHVFAAAKFTDRIPNYQIPAFLHYVNKYIETSPDYQKEFVSPSDFNISKINKGE